MSQEKRKRPAAPAEPLPSDLTAKSETEYTPQAYAAGAFSDASGDGLQYAEDMRRRRSASRRLPTLPNGQRDPFGGAR